MSLKFCIPFTFMQDERNNRFLLVTNPRAGKAIDETGDWVRLNPELSCSEQKLFPASCSDKTLNLEAFIRNVQLTTEGVQFSFVEDYALMDDDND